jgi:hypothetical protein
MCPAFAFALLGQSTFRMCHIPSIDR